MKKRSIILLVLGLAIVTYLLWRAIASPRDVEKDGKTVLNVQLQWFDGAQFAGLYVAKEKGYFTDEGLHVKLIPLNSFTSDPIALLTDGEAEISIASADQVLINKDKGKEIKVFGTVFNRSLAGYMYKKKNNTDTFSLKDLENKTIGVFKKFDTENILLSLIKKNNLNIKDEHILQAGTLDAFINDKLDIYGSYLINEPIEMQKVNIKTGFLDPIKYGVYFYSDTYITKTDYWTKNPDLIVKFLRAANKGWDYAKRNPEEAIDIMFKNIKNKTRNDFYEKELASLKEAIKYIGDGPDNQPSYMKKEVWLNLEKDLFDIKRISQTGYIDDLVDFKILNKTNGK